MALRPGRTMRRKERPYTRVSYKKPRESYVVGVPSPKIHIFEMGTQGQYDRILYLVSKMAAQIRSNALESARIVAHKFLQTKLGSNYFFKILVYPHQVIREKPIATGAGADRYSQGMRLAFGKPKLTAVRAEKGTRIMELRIKKEDLKIGKDALKRASSKLPIPCSIVIE